MIENDSRPVAFLHWKRWNQGSRNASLGAIHPAQSRRIGIGSFAFGQVRRLDGLADVEPSFSVTLLVRM
jgi:hypothetical protein